VRHIGRGRIEGVAIMSMGISDARYVVFSSSGVEPNVLVVRGHSGQDHTIKKEEAKTNERGEN
jgi:hypothetical protein